MNATWLQNLTDSSKQMFTPGRSLLLPMFLLALGIHAALLVLPFPSTEPTRAADDKKNPIAVTQIPTEKPIASTSATGGTVDVPPLPTTSTGTDTASTSGSSPSSSTSTFDSATSTSSSSSGYSTRETTSSASTPAKSTQSAKSSPDSTPVTDSSSSQSSTPEASPSSETASLDAKPTPAGTTTAKSVSNNGAIATYFAEFPHYQPSEADCYGLGFGENCRLIENREMAQVAEFFKKELAAKDFTANLITDEPGRKVFKVVKGDKTLFLTLWQGKNKITYLLSRVLVKQAPEDLKADAAK